MWKERLSLSARRPPELYEKSDDVGNVPHAGALRTTLDDLGAAAVFCVQHVPTVVILSVDEFEPAHVARLHAALWNQGLASLLVVISGDTVRVFTLARIPRSDDDDPVTACLVDELDAVTHALALRNLVYGAESGRFWEDHPDHFKPEERVDRVLLGNLTESHRLLCDAGLSTGAAQALLIQAMFVAYLEDRKIIGGDYFRSASEASGDFETLLQSGRAESLESLFDTLRADFNGDLFVAPCSFEVNDRGPRLQAAHLQILSRFRSGREEMRGRAGQYRLWRYDFKYIPVEPGLSKSRRRVGLVAAVPARRAGACRAAGLLGASPAVSGLRRSFRALRERVRRLKVNGRRSDDCWPRGGVGVIVEPVCGRGGQLGTGFRTASSASCGRAA